MCHKVRQLENVGEERVMEKYLSRRSFLGVSASAAMMATLAGCGGSGSDDSGSASG